ncbi:MAG: ABC transporter ATP-binding protein [Lachnospiraceae bacterium]|nr:ABC transporter ATP-binding protein [Lachnospiraceae bacterium]
MSHRAYIKIENLSVSFEDKRIIENLTAELPKGQSTVIMGASGIGKTTLLKALMGLVDIESGSIEGIENMRISAVFQEDRLVPSKSAVENISLCMRRNERGIRLISQRERLSERGKILAELERLGIDEHKASQPVSELSGGMRRRVSLLRALMSEYDIILMDEPFTGLDDDTKIMVMEYTKAAISGKTAVIVTHSRTEAEYFSDNFLTI